MTAACPTCFRLVSPNSRGVRSHTNLETGKLCETRQITFRHYVMVEFNTDADGNWVDANEMSEEDVPKCIYGPFETEQDAHYWMTDVYPPDDTDVFDMYSWEPEDPKAIGYVNHPDVVKPRRIHAS